MQRHRSRGCARVSFLFKFFPPARGLLNQLERLCTHCHQPANNGVDQSVLICAAVFPRTGGRSEATFASSMTDRKQRDCSYTSRSSYFAPCECGVKTVTPGLGHYKHRERKPYPAARAPMNLNGDGVGGREHGGQDVVHVADRTHTQFFLHAEIIQTGAADQHFHAYALEITQ